MNETLLIIAGTVGWFGMIVVGAWRGCVEGHAPSAIVGGLMLSILSMDLWAFVPGQLRRKFPDQPEAVLLEIVLWLAALAPHVVLLRRGLKFRRNSLGIGGGTARGTGVDSLD